MIRKTVVLDILIVFSAFFLLIMFGCNRTPTEPVTNGTSTDKQAMMKIAESDSSIASFQPNYDEESAMDLSTDENGNKIYPVKFGQKLRLVSRNLTYTVNGDTAYGKYTQVFEGVLYIAGSFSPDTLIANAFMQKPFSTIITRNIIFIRTGNSDQPILNWKIAAVSLPEGGTMNSNVKIKKIIVSPANGDSVSVNDPNDYYLSRGAGWWRKIPFLKPAKPVTVQVEVNSSYADTDFVTLTHGADFKGFHREKVKFNLVSSTRTADGYDKVYSNTFYPHKFPGFFNAVINIYSKQEIFDNSAPVEIDSWGIPYIVK